MLSSWSAINDSKIPVASLANDPKSNFEESIEAQESNAKKDYERALTLLTGNPPVETLEKACDAFEAILNQGIIKQFESKDKEPRDKPPVSSALSSLVNLSSQIKYLCLTNLAYAEERLQQYDKSVSHLLAAIALNDSDPSLWMSLGKISFKLGDLNLSRHALESALNMFNTTTTVSWQCMELLLECYQKLNDDRNALELAQRMLSIDPFYPKLIALRNKLLVDQNGDLERPSSGLSSLRTVLGDAIQEQQLLVAKKYCIQPPKVLEGSTASAPEKLHGLPHIEVVTLKLQQKGSTWLNLIELIMNAAYETQVDSSSGSSSEKVSDTTVEDHKKGLFSDCYWNGVVEAQAPRWVKLSIAHEESDAYMSEVNDSSAKTTNSVAVDEIEDSAKTGTTLQDASMDMPSQVNGKQACETIEQVVEHKVEGGEKVLDQVGPQSTEGKQDAETSVNPRKRARSIPDPDDTNISLKTKQPKQTSKQATPRRRSSRLEKVKEMKQQVSQDPNSAAVYHHGAFMQSIKRSLCFTPSPGWSDLTVTESEISLTELTVPEDFDESWINDPLRRILESLSVDCKSRLNLSVLHRLPKVPASATGGGNQAPQEAAADDAMTNKPELLALRDLEHHDVERFVEKNRENVLSVPNTLAKVAVEICTSKTVDTSNDQSLARRFIQAVAALRRCGYIPAQCELGQVSLEEAELVLSGGEVCLGLAMQEAAERAELAEYLRGVEASTWFVTSLLAQWTDVTKEHPLVVGGRTEQLEFAARACWLVGNKAAMRDHTGEAIESLERCEEILCSSFDSDHTITIPILNSKLNVEIVKNRVEALKSTKTSHQARLLFVRSTEMGPGDGKLETQNAIIEILKGKFLPNCPNNVALLQHDIEGVEEIVKDFTLISLSRDQCEDDFDIVQMLWTCCLDTNQLDFFTCFAIKLMLQLSDRFMYRLFKANNQSKPGEDARDMFMMEPARASLFIHVLLLLSRMFDTVEDCTNHFGNETITALPLVLFRAIVICLSSREGTEPLKTCVELCLKIRAPQAALDVLLYGVANLLKYQRPSAPTNLKKGQKKEWMLQQQKDLEILISAMELLSLLHKQAAPSWQVVLESDGTASVTNADEVALACGYRTPKSDNPRNTGAYKTAVRVFQVALAVLSTCRQEANRTEKLKDSFDKLFYQSFTCLLTACMDCGMCGLVLRLAYVFLDSRRAGESGRLVAVRKLQEALQDGRLVLSLRSYTPKSGTPSNAGYMVGLEKLRQFCLDECFKAEFGVGLIPSARVSSTGTIQLPSPTDMCAVNRVFGYALPYLVSEMYGKKKSTMAEIVQLMFQQFCAQETAGPHQAVINEFLNGEGLEWPHLFSSVQHSAKNQTPSGLTWVEAPKRGDICPRVLLPQCCLDPPRPHGQESDLLVRWLPLLMFEYKAAPKVIPQLKHMFSRKESLGTMQHMVGQTCEAIHKLMSKKGEMDAQAEVQLYVALCRADLAFNPWRIDSWYNMLCSLRELLDIETEHARYNDDLYSSYCVHFGGKSQFSSRWKHLAVGQLLQSSLHENAHPSHDTIPSCLKLNGTGGEITPQVSGTESGGAHSEAIGNQQGTGGSENQQGTSGSENQQGTSDSGNQQATSESAVIGNQQETSHSRNQQGTNQEKNSSQGSLTIMRLNSSKRTAESDMAHIISRRKMVAMTVSALIGLLQQKLALGKSDESELVSSRTYTLSGDFQVVPGAIVDAKWVPNGEHELATVIRVQQHESWGTLVDIVFIDGEVFHRIPISWIREELLMTVLEKEEMLQRLFDAHETKALMLYEQVHEMRFLEIDGSESLLQECLSHLNLAEAIGIENEMSTKDLATIYLMQGKVLRKLKRKPHEFINAFANAVTQSKGEKWKIDSCYYLHSARLKLALGMGIGRFALLADPQNSSDHHSASTFSNLLTLLEEHPFEAPKATTNPSEFFKKVAKWCRVVWNFPYGSSETTDESSDDGKLPFQKLARRQLSVVLNCFSALDHCRLRKEAPHHQSIYRMAWAFQCISERVGLQLAGEIMKPLFVKRKGACGITIWRRDENADYALLIESVRKFDYFRIKYTLFYLKTLGRISDCNALLLLFRSFVQSKDYANFTTKLFAQQVFLETETLLQKMLNSSPRQGNSPLEQEENDQLEKILEYSYILYAEELASRFETKEWNAIVRKLKLLLVEGYSRFTGKTPESLKEVVAFCESKWKQGLGVKYSKSKLRLKRR